MTMQPTDALQQQVDRGDIADHDVEVDVERLLQHLRANHDQPFGTPAGLRSETLNQVSFSRRTMRGNELGVHQYRPSPRSASFSARYRSWARATVEQIRLRNRRPRVDPVAGTLANQVNHQH